VPVSYVTQGESYTSILRKDAAESELISDVLEDNGNVCCSQMSPRFWGETDMEFSVLKMKGTIF